MADDRKPGWQMHNFLNNFLEWHAKEHPEFNPDAISLPEKYDLLYEWIADQLIRLEVAVGMLDDLGHDLDAEIERRHAAADAAAAQASVWEQHLKTWEQQLKFWEQQLKS
jgi:hypothetical protein